MSTLHELLKAAGPLKSDAELIPVIERALSDACPPPAAVAWRFTIQRDEFGRIDTMLAVPLDPAEVQQ